MAALRIPCPRRGLSRRCGFARSKMRESDGARGRRASQSEPSAHDEREGQGRRHDGNASGYSGWEQPHEVSRYPPGHSLRTNNLESLAPPPTTGGRDAFSGLGTRGGGASTRGTHDFHRQSFPPRTARNDICDAVRAPAPTPAALTATSFSTSTAAATAVPSHFPHRAATAVPHSSHCAATARAGCHCSRFSHALLGKL